MNHLPHIYFFIYFLPRSAQEGSSVGVICLSWLTQPRCGPPLPVSCTCRTILSCYRELRPGWEPPTLHLHSSVLGFSSKHKPHSPTDIDASFSLWKPFSYPSNNNKKTKPTKVWEERNPSSAGLCPEMGKVPVTPLSLLCCPYWFYVDGSQMLWGEQSSEAELTCIRMACAAEKHPAAFPWGSHPRSLAVLCLCWWISTPLCLDSVCAAAAASSCQLWLLEAELGKNGTRCGTARCAHCALSCFCHGHEVCPKNLSRKALAWKHWPRVFANSEIPGKSSALTFHVFIFWSFFRIVAREKLLVLYWWGFLRNKPTKKCYFSAF